MKFAGPSKIVFWSLLGRSHGRESVRRGRGGVASDVVKVEGEHPAAPGPLKRNDTGTVTIPQQSNTHPTFTIASCPAKGRIVRYMMMPMYVHSRALCTHVCSRMHMCFVEFPFYLHASTRLRYMYTYNVSVLVMSVEASHATWNILSTPSELYVCAVHVFLCTHWLGSGRAKYAAIASLARTC